MVDTLSGASGAGGSRYGILFSRGIRKSLALNNVILYEYSVIR